MSIEFDKTGLESYITDQMLEAEMGIWVRFPGGRRFRILRAGGSNRRFSRAFTQALRPHRRAFERGTLDDEVSDQILRDTYARHVVVDWDGINDASGQKVPYSPEAVSAFFEAFPDLFSDLVTIASDIATFSQERIEEAKEAVGEV
jgi:hypothetical protein